MKYPQSLVDAVWREHEAGMPSKETAKHWNLTINQVRYVIRKKRASWYIPFPFNFLPIFHLF